MAFHFLLIFILLNFAFGGSHATMTKEELHWISVFPHTPMPKVLQQILPIPGQSILPKGDTAPNQNGVNDPEFGAYWYGDNSDKESKTEVIQKNKGVNDPEFGAYWYGDNSDKESTTEDILTNKRVNDPDNSDKESEIEDIGPTNKGANDDHFGLYFVGDSSENEPKAKDIDPTNKGANDDHFGLYFVGDSSEKEPKAKDIDPTNKGANDDHFGLYFVGDSSEKDPTKNSDKEPKAKDIDPTNKGTNDDHFGLYFVGDSSEKDPTRNSDKEPKAKHIDPTNKGANDDHFGLYFVGDSSEKDPTRNSDKEPKAKHIDPTNKGANDDHFGLYFVGDSSEKDPTRNSDKELKTEGIDPTNKGANDDHFGLYFVGDSSEHNAANKKVNRKVLGGKSSHESTSVKETIYFFQENLLSGTKVNLPRLIKKSDMATFLPQQIADSMPLSNDNLPQILNNFTLKAESKGANDVKTTVKNCDRSEMKGETKYCATSLESFVDLSVSVLGKRIHLLSHDLGKDMKTPYFTISQGVQKMGDNNIVCHKMKYPYAVYLCHSIEKTEVYKVPLVSKDGTKVKAVAACHKDTSNWSPNHIAFKLLKVKPGIVPICHFLGRDTLVWIPY